MVDTTGTPLLVNTYVFLDASGNLRTKDTKEVLRQAHANERKQGKGGVAFWSEVFYDTLKRNAPKAFQNYIDSVKVVNNEAK